MPQQRERPLQRLVFVETRASDGGIAPRETKCLLGQQAIEERLPRAARFGVELNADGAEAREQLIA